MNYYKVFFEDNHATYAMKLKSVELDSAKIDIVDGRRAIRWLNVFAENESDSIRLANNVIRGYLQFLSNGEASASPPA